MATVAATGLVPCCAAGYRASRAAQTPSQWPAAPSGSRRRRTAWRGQCSEHVGMPPTHGRLGALASMSRSRRW
eukprot:353408-Chlamydomonas_euryale.AAC.5